jgi:hypothetical protein
MRLIIALFGLCSTLAQRSESLAGIDAAQSQNPEGSESEDKQQSSGNANPSKIPMLMMLNKAGVITDSELRQQMAKELLSKSPQDRSLPTSSGGGGDFMQTMLLMNAIGGGQQQGRGQDPMKAMLISSALSDQGKGSSLLPILLMSSLGNTEVSGSCVGRCGIAAARQGCSCDAACRQNGDCCDDFDTVCTIQDQSFRQFSTMQVPQQFPGGKGKNFQQFQPGQLPPQQFQQFQPQFQQFQPQFSGGQVQPPQSGQV